MDNAAKKTNNVSLSSDSMPSNTSEDFEHLDEKVYPYIFHSHPPIEQQILSDIVNSNKYQKKNNFKERSPIRANKQFKTPNPRKVMQLDINKSHLLPPPKVYLQNQTCKKHILKKLQVSDKVRQPGSISEAENSSQIFKSDHPYGYENFIRNRIKCFPIDMASITPPENDFLKVSKESGKRQSKSLDKGHLSNQNIQINQIEKFQIKELNDVRSPKSFENFSSIQTALCNSKPDRILKFQEFSQDSKLENYSNFLCDFEDQVDKCTKKGNHVENIQHHPKNEKVNKSNKLNIDENKENKMPKTLLENEKVKLSKSVWNNYFRQFQHKMQEDLQGIQENKKYLPNALFEFESERALHQPKIYDFESNRSSSYISRFTPSTSSSVQKEKYEEKYKAKLIQNQSLAGVDSRYKFENNSNFIKRPKRGHSSRVQDKNNKRCFETISQRAEKTSSFDKNEKNIDSSINYNLKEKISKSVLYELNNGVNQMKKPVELKLDEDLSEFIRIEMGLSQEEQIFQSPCLIRNSSETSGTNLQISLSHESIDPLKSLNSTQNKYSIQSSSITSPKIDTGNIIEKIKDSKNKVSIATRCFEDKQDLYLEKQVRRDKENKTKHPSCSNSMHVSVSLCRPTTSNQFELNLSKHAKSLSNGMIEENNTISNILPKRDIECFDTSSESQKQNIKASKKLKDFIDRKNENFLLNICSKSGLDSFLQQNLSLNKVYSSNDENTGVQEEKKSRKSYLLELLKGPSRLPTIEEANSIQIRLNSEKGNKHSPKYEKDLFNNSQFSDRCVSEPSGYNFKKLNIYRTECISKSFDDLNCFKDYPKKFVSQSEFSSKACKLISHEKLCDVTSQKARKSQSQDKLESLDAIYSSILKPEISNNIGNIKLRIETFSSSRDERYKLIHSKQEGKKLRQKRASSINNQIKIKECSFEENEKSIQSKIIGSKRASLDINNKRATQDNITQDLSSKFQTYTILDKTTRSKSSDQIKLKRLKDNIYSNATSNNISSSKLGKREKDNRTFHK